MKVEVNLMLTLEEDIYRIKLELPGTSPTYKDPFRFEVNQSQYSTKIEKDAANKETKKIGTDEVADSKTTLLRVLVGSPSQLYVAVKPPKTLLDAAKVGDVVKDLDVKVSNDYDEKTGKFSEPKSGTGGAG